jgi:hypothetical protein
VVSEKVVSEDEAFEAEHIAAEDGSDDEAEEDNSISSPSKPSHIKFGKSTVTAEDMIMMKKLGYFGEAESKLVRFAGEEVVPEPKEDEVVVFKSFFRAWLRFPLYDLIGEVLKKFEIYLHQLTPNAIVRLSVYIWAFRSQGMSANAKGFCRVHELHYHTKARADGLHKKFGCYNFAYRKDTKALVIGYRTKWPTGWTSEWFYIKADEKKREKLMTMVMSPMRLSFGMTRPLCHMQLGSPCQLAKVKFRVVAAEISTRDLVQEYLANRTFPTSSGWGMPKKKEGGKRYELVQLPYRFKFEKQFKKPCSEWLEMIETMCNEIFGNYTKKEDQLMTVSFGTWPKRRLNRVMDALNFEYPDYEKLDEGAEGVKRKRVVSILSRQAARSVKEDEKALKKARIAPEPKATIPKKRKLDRIPSTEPKVDGAAQKTPPSPSAAEVTKILKVMTESPPFKLLSPLRLELTKLLQRKETPSATEEKIEGQKKRRILNVMQAIEQTPPSASATKATIPADAEDVGKAEAEYLDVTMSEIDKLVSDVVAYVVAEKTSVVTEENMAVVPDKGKEIDNTHSDKKDFDLRHLGGQELSEQDKLELKEFAISSGYQPGSMLFGEVDEEILGCIRDRAGAKIVGTLSKSVGFPKLETDISCYRRKHIVGSLFYSNFKVRLFSRFFYIHYLCSRLSVLILTCFGEHVIKQGLENAAGYRG